MDRREQVAQFQAFSQRLTTLMQQAKSAAVELKRARKRRLPLERTVWSLDRSKLPYLLFHPMYKVLVWNIRGARGVASCRRLKKLVSLHSISFVVLLEPMADVNNLE